MNLIWFKLQKHLRRTNSLQIILLSITVHSLLSIFLIYIHLGWFLDNELSSKNEPSGLTSKHGGIVLARRRHQVNLISSDVVGPNDISLSHRGWWMDHTKWNVGVECFPQKWLLCSKVFSSQCKPEGVRSLYQYLPIRSDVALQTIEMSLRAKNRHLDEQAAEATYGLHALVNLSDGSTETLKIELPVELDDWTKRSIRYSSPPGTHILEVTVMLTCVGYLGTVSFTDIEVIPLPEANWGASPSDVLDICARHFSEPSRKAQSTYKMEDVVLKTSSGHSSATHRSNKGANSLTLVTQVSMDRLTVLEKTLSTWVGPVSLSIYAAVKNATEGLVEWQRLYIEKKVRNLNLSPKSHVTLVVGGDDESDYPINVLRNVAITKATTKYILLTDADFQPCPEFTRRFENTLSKYSDTAQLAFVPPAFEYLETPKNGDGIPKAKEELLQLMFRDDTIIQPFRISESGEAHRNTDYWKWYYATSNFKVSEFSDKYEPYVIVERSGAPLFDEQFVGYGMNKVTHINELYAAGYTFEVLHDMWLIHMPHKSTSFSQEFLQSPALRLQNRYRRFQFIRKLAFKYQLNKMWTDC